MLLLAATLVAIASCGVDDPGMEVRAAGTPRAAADPSTVPAAVSAVNAFGLDLHRAASSLRSGNLVLSPWAVASTLAMARAGATGETRTQLDRALHVAPATDFDAGVNGIDQVLANRVGDRRSAQRKGRVDIDVARSLWAPRGTSFAPAFLTDLAADHGSGMRVVDFRSDPETARSAINAWVAGATDQAITQIAPRGSVSDVSSLVAASALYPRAPWEVRFPADRTRPSRFTIDAGESVDPPTMQLATGEGLLHAHGDGFDAVELPYLGQELALLLIVPDPGTLDAFTDQLDAGRLDQIVQSLQPGPVDLRLPRFAFTSDLDLDAALRSLGATDALDDRLAEFGGITTDEPLSLSANLHQAFVSVDEEGTQARAATVQAPAEAVPPGPATATRLVVDRPFLFALRDRQTGVLLALGHVVNPLG